MSDTTAPVTMGDIVAPVLAASRPGGLPDELLLHILKYALTFDGNLAPRRQRQDIYQTDPNHEAADLTFLHLRQSCKILSRIAVEALYSSNHIMLGAPRSHPSLGVPSAEILSKAVKHPGSSTNKWIRRVDISLTLPVDTPTFLQRLFETNQHWHFLLKFLDGSLGFRNLRHLTLNVLLINEGIGKSEKGHDLVGLTAEFLHGLGCYESTRVRVEQMMVDFFRGSCTRSITVDDSNFFF
ncbi:hypothetical protein P154DRAFT_516871 [Amniculicola lignicola CBS 123094]|uniref:Uncharacterized protein n=1 Tax=Amniculicola lignicola CBS 123094 TaxID=1392246 RepID=A0A6A5X5D1_9PLEO|nr:hypothetical protein P154DRAFT_516871 [Amniculicola lignicola CBS 123094]